jgi:hypothetical protein
LDIQPLIDAGLFPTLIKILYRLIRSSSVSKDIWVTDDDHSPSFEGFKKPEIQDEESFAFVNSSASLEEPADNKQQEIKGNNVNTAIEEATMDEEQRALVRDFFWSLLP